MISQIVICTRRDAGFCLTSFKNLATYPIDKTQRWVYTAYIGRTKQHTHGDDKMATNKYAGTCIECGEVVLPGQGEIFKAWDNHKDDVAWKVKHNDSNVCASVKASETSAIQCTNAFNAIIAYIKEFGDKQNVAIYGSETIIDKRRGYNQVGWIVTVDAQNTIYLTSANNLDGLDMSETYIMQDYEDDGFGNSNADIKGALLSIVDGTAVNTDAFVIA